MKQKTKTCVLGLVLGIAACAVIFALPLQATDKAKLKVNIDAMRAEIEANGYTFTVGETPVMNYDPEQLLKERHPMAYPEACLGNAYFALPALETELPPAYIGYYTPVKNQGACGSGWAFSAVGILEAIILQNDGIVVDLSEQQVVSCNPWGWGCNGGYWANDFLVSPGLMLESCYPYAALDMPCVEDCPILYAAQGWGFVGGQYDVPSIEEIKLAILTYGSVQAGVYADSFFMAYTGGVFNKCKKNARYTNLSIILCGWDDAKGAWLLKNSWGEAWGENGFMWISYTCNLVGEGANFVVY